MIVGLTGYKGVGKDTVGNLLLVFGYTRRAFADPLKAIAKVIGWDGRKDTVPPCPTCGILQGRELLQVLGTEGVRDNVAKDAWIQAMRASMEPGKNYVITDVRFPNEAELVHALGGIVVRVTRPGHNGDGHVSEKDQASIEVDATINNKGSIVHLAGQVHTLVADLEAHAHITDVATNNHTPLTELVGKPMYRDQDGTVSDRPFRPDDIPVSGTGGL